MVQVFGGMQCPVYPLVPPTSSAAARHNEDVFFLPTLAEEAGPNRKKTAFGRNLWTTRTKKPDPLLLSYMEPKCRGVKVFM
jgi:hypothetical protein